MDFMGTRAECLELIAEIDAARGYPRTFTQADIDDGTIVRRGVGRHVPLERLSIVTCARVRAVDADVDGNPTGSRRRVRIRDSAAAERVAIARRRMRRILSRGSARKLRTIDGIGAVRANQIIAARVPGETLRISDLEGVIPQRAIDALVAHRRKLRDIDADDTTDESQPAPVAEEAAPKRRR